MKAAKEFAKFELALGVTVVTLALIFVSGYFATIVESLLIQVFNGTFLIAAIPVGVMMFLREGPLNAASKAQKGTDPWATVMVGADRLYVKPKTGYQVKGLPEVFMGFPVERIAELAS